MKEREKQREREKDAWVSRGEGGQRRRRRRRKIRISANLMQQPNASGEPLEDELAVQGGRDGGDCQLARRELEGNI